MAAMSTILNERSSSSDSHVWTVNADHTAQKQALVLQKRKTPTGDQVVMEDHVMVRYDGEDADGMVLKEPVSVTVIVRRSKHAIAADVSAALATARDIVAGDEFTDVVNKQEPLIYQSNAA